MLVFFSRDGKRIDRTFFEGVGAMKRVVITGMGLITALGHTVEETWEALCQGRSGIGPIRNFDASAYPVRFAGEVRDFEPSRYLEHKEIRRNDPFAHLAVAA